MQTSLTAFRLDHPQNPVCQPPTTQMLSHSENKKGQLSSTLSQNVY